MRAKGFAASGARSAARRCLQNWQATADWVLGETLQAPVQEHPSPPIRPFRFKL